MEWGIALGRHFNEETWAVRGRYGPEFPSERLSRASDVRISMCRAFGLLG